MAKWIKKIPESPHQVLAIINEANALYEIQRASKKIDKDKAENSYLEQGVVMGATVKCLNCRGIDKETPLKVFDIKGNSVHVEVIETGKKWRIKNCRYEVM